MMLGERHNPTVQIPPWTLFDDPTAGTLYTHHPATHHPAQALHHYLPSNEIMLDDPEPDLPGLGLDVAVDEYSSDEFRMYEFKIRRCARGRSHDWTDCPFAHPGEKAKRRDPRKFHYSGTACPDFRKGSCKRGDSCEYAHGVFECWLHPARYRTQPCKDGTGCRRRVCFFAHTPDQLRVLQQQQHKSPRGAVESYDGSPLRHAIYKSSSIVTSPTSTLVSGPFSSSPSDSPPVSPDGLSTRRALLSNAVNDVLAFSLGQLQINKGDSWGGSPRPGGLDLGSVLRSLPSNPTEPMATGKMGGMGLMHVWEDGTGMERVESGRNLRANTFEKLRRENWMDMSAAAPDVGWVSDLVK
ncbi:hypothetical protein MRB53_017708 [Persea americana]|uniref:Uncharacterized protein n=1 Tax=Persea americana TaxID=3435 RepID=A0ACC2M5Z1_PERAE|nr:hypothetical protein MRB53_017708 [Persea americana]